MKLTRVFAPGMVLLCMLWAMAGTATAHDFNPPPWRDLTHPFSTLQGWDFLTPANPATPDHPGLPLVVGDGFGGGLPTATMFNMQWNPGSPTDFPGVWGPNDPSGGFILLDIPNWIDTEPIKWISVQTTFIGSNPPLITNIFGDESGQAVFGVPIAPPLVTPLDPLNGIFGVTEQWEMRPNPDWETIEIFVPPDVAIDQIVVDTISFPEPGSMALVAIGLAVVMRRHRG